MLVRSERVSGTSSKSIRRETPILWNDINNAYLDFELIRMAKCRGAIVEV